jgi:hypothetical protein
LLKAGQRGLVFGALVFVLQMSMLWLLKSWLKLVFKATRVTLQKKVLA